MNETTKIKNKLEKSLEDGLEYSRKNSSLYLILATVLFFITNIGTITVYAGIPVFLYKNKYLCKDPLNPNLFTTKCSRKFICDNKNRIDVDYILDEKNTIYSFITVFDIYCSNIKQVILTSSFFLGGMLGNIIYPYLLKNNGLLNTIVIFYILISISFFSLIKFNYYILGVIFYTISAISHQICTLGFKQYIIEMSSPLSRPIYLLINLLAGGFSGFFVIMITFMTLDYRRLLFWAGVICFIGALLIKLFVVESVRILFIQDNRNEILKNLEYISKINNSSNEFREWKKNNKMFFNNENNKDEKEYMLLDYNDNSYINKNMIDDINFINIWTYPSQVKLLILFSIGVYLFNYSIILSQLEMRKQNKFFLSLFEAYICDIIGYIIGILINNIKDLSRKLSLIIITFSLGIVLLISNLIYSNQFIFILLRIFVNAFDSNLTLYNFESFPTLTRSNGIAINRILGKFFNIPTPFIMVSFPKKGYFFGFLFSIGFLALILFLSPAEMKGESINEYPLEIGMKIYKKEKKDDDINESQNTNNIKISNKDVDDYRLNSNL